ncbi:hypothetical protein ACFXG4_35430 [Nocardia sp. NPDC059246]|uniref:hypothetical protein n=1 Tax=unclassified Nocardia TaxID=2637762 RepID=UPI00369DF6C1
MLHDRLAEYRALDVADDLARELRTREVPAADLRSLARRLLENGTRRNAVALGIVMLGVAGDHRDRELLLLLGSLEDLTLYAAVALANSQQNRDTAVYELAQRVDGWGRIHAVERLAGTQDPEIKNWLLRTGFRNRILNEYLAHLAATTGDLHTALLAPDVDAELLDSTADLLAALTGWGGPAQDIRHYPDALPVLARFAELLHEAPPTLRIVCAAGSFPQQLKRAAPKTDWEPTRTSAVIDRYSALLERPDWRELVVAELLDPADDFALNQALQCSEAVGFDAYPHALAHLRTGVLSVYAWQWVAKRTPDHEVAELARLTQEQLPLDEMASGPLSRNQSRSLWQPEDHILEVVLARLDRRSGDVGVPLLRAGIRGRTVRLRSVAIRKLAEVFGPDLPADVREWVGAAAVAEPDEVVRTELVKLLERATLDFEQ